MVSLSISPYTFTLALEMRKQAQRDKSPSSDRAGYDWHFVCLTANPALIALPASQPREVRLLGQDLLGEQVSGMSVGKEAWGQGTLPVPGLTIP